jgi:hypothetical protein
MVFLYSVVSNMIVAVTNLFSCGLKAGTSSVAKIPVLIQPYLDLIDHFLVNQNTEIGV